MDIKGEAKSMFTVNRFIDFLSFFAGVYVGKLVSGYLPVFKYSQYVYSGVGVAGVLYGIKDGGLLKSFVLGIGAELAIANLMPLIPKV